MKQILFIALLAVTAISVKAQDTTYIDNAGRTVKSLQLADYYRVVKPDANDVKQAKGVEYYKSGKLKAKYKLVDKGFDKVNWMIDGQYKAWYENGKRKSKIDFLIGLKNGTLLTYWPNGKLKRKEIFEFSKSISGDCYNDKGDKIDFYPYFQPAKYIGGTDSLYSHIRKNIHQIPTDSGKVLAGQVKLDFIVTTDGSLSEVTVDKSSDARLNEEATRIISIMPQWTPALQDGEPLPTTVSQMIRFGKNELNDGRIFNVIEQMPQFPGGEKALMNFISRIIRYPVYAMERNIQGRVVVRFVVNEEGDVSQITVLRGIGGGCDEEAMRVVSLMPRWTPGKQDGKPVSVWYTLPISFKFLGTKVNDSFNSNQNRNFRSF